MCNVHFWSLNDVEHEYGRGWYCNVCTKRLCTEKMEHYGPLISGWNRWLVRIDAADARLRTLTKSNEDRTKKDS